MGKTTISIIYFVRDLSLIFFLINSHFLLLFNFCVNLETGGASIQALPTLKTDMNSGNSVENTNTNESSSPALNGFGNLASVVNALPGKMEMDAEAAAAAAAAANNFVSQNHAGKNQIVSLTVTIKLDPRANLLDKPTVG